MKNKTIFVACDTSNLNQIKNILKNTRNKKDHQTHTDKQAQNYSKIWITIFLF